MATTYPPGAEPPVTAHQPHAHHLSPISPTTTAVNGKATHGSKVAGAGTTRPTFRQWVKLYYVDLLTMAAMGAIGLGVYNADPAPSRSFPLTFSDGEIVYPEFAYPLRHEIIPIWLAAFLAFIIPFVIFGVVQIRVRSFEDFNTATFGLLYSLINAAVFQVFIKWLIGGLRPHFLIACQPVVPAGMVGTGYQMLMFDRSICTGDPAEINDSLESMPSGHSTAAWAGFVFLSLYLNAKLKLFSDYRPQMWKLIAFSAPILGAFLISGALTIDEYHNWYDVVAGGFIGTFSAFAAYRMSYAAIWDFRWNHIPLPRLSPSVTGDLGRFQYNLSTEESIIMPFAGAWRTGIPSAGAPGDAARS